MTEQHMVIGNALDVLRTLDSSSVDCIVTSPPYWALRDYGNDPITWGGDSECEHQWGNDQGETEVPEEGAFCTKCGAWLGQLGLEPTPNMYIEHLVRIFSDARRVLKDEGSLWVNLGDTYATVSGSGYQQDNINPEKVVKCVKKANDIKKQCFKKSYSSEYITGSEHRNNAIVSRVTPPSIPEKSLCQIPSRFSIAMTDDGWILRNEVIWHKPNPMPVSVTDRFTVDFEKFYFFTKSQKYYFSQQHEGKNGRNMRTTWDIPTKANPLGHVAMFPSELIDTPIRACCPEGGTVMDCFCGSGTVLEYCRKHDLNGIGIEINPKYGELIKKRSMMDIASLQRWVQ